jgi:hypothetical protein
MRIDHLIFAVPELEDGVAEIEARFGVRAEGGGQHVGQGTHNKLLALGPTTYLEIIAPLPLSDCTGHAVVVAEAGVTHSNPVPAGPYHSWRRCGW